MTDAKKPMESILYDVVGQYLSRKLDSKYDLQWKNSKTDEDKQEFDEKRAKLAKDAFLAVRARTGADFIDYFVSTICSVRQYLPEETFRELSAALYADTARVRTLTMLALSARS